MIRINLLPHRQTQQQADALTLRRQTLLVLATTLVVGAGLSLVLWLMLLRQQQHNQATHRLIHTQRPQALAAQAAANHLNQLQQQRQALAAHLAKQTQAWRVLTQLQASMPNGLYFTQVSWHPPLLSLEGQAGSHEAIALLLAELNQQHWLQQVTLLSSQQQAGLWTFALHAQTLGEDA